MDEYSANDNRLIMANKCILMRVLLKISGDFFAGINKDIKTFVFSKIQDLLDSNIKLVIVVGGGNIIRGSQANEEGIGRVESDTMGILSTMINAFKIKSELQLHDIRSEVLSSVDNTLCQHYSVNKANHILDTVSKVIICAGGLGIPFISTDTASVIRALELKCKCMLKATKIDGVYSDDPLKNVKAVKLDNVSYDYILHNNLGIMDMSAICIAKEHKLLIKIFNMYNTSILDVLNNKSNFSVISN